MTQEAKFRGIDAKVVRMGKGKAARNYVAVTFIRITDGAELVTGYTGDNYKTYVAACGTCAGSGYRHEYRHVEGGRCWKCVGRGVVVPKYDSLGKWLESVSRRTRKVNS